MSASFLGFKLANTVTNSSLGQFHGWPLSQWPTKPSIDFLDQLGLEHINTLPQFAIFSALKTSAYNDLTTFLQNQSDALLRLRTVSAQQWPAFDQHSDVHITKSDGHPDHLRHRPTGLFALHCPCELSSPAFITSAALILGIPVPHAKHYRPNCCFPVACFRGRCILYSREISGVIQGELIQLKVI